VSFLGTGDQYCFSTGEITPAPGKRALAPEDCAHLESRRMTRSVFGTYAFYEMLVRLAEANPEYYCQESASAYDHELQQMASLILTYRPDESRAWRDDNPEEYRYSLCNYGLDIQVETQSREARQVWLKRYATDLLGDNTLIDPQARLVMVGGPLRAGDDGGVIGYLASFAPRRMGVLGTASHEPGCQARRYVDLLRDYGLPAEDLNITLENSLYQSRDPGVEAAILDCDMVLLCGGSQQRLIDALLYHGEGSRLLKALIRTWTRGATLVGVSGAASVFSRMMICGGNSYDAFYFGRAIDVSQKGVDIEEGFHLFRFGMVDQNVHERYRLGRLIYACASENERFGFGVLENSAMVDTGNAGVLEAVGEAGFIVVDLGQARKVMNMTRVQVDGIRVRLVRPGQCFRVAGNRVEGTPATSERAVALDDVLEELLFHFHYQAHPDDRAEGLGALTMGVEVLSPDDLLLDMGMMREKLIPRDQRMIDREN
jgi:cyanophycinase